MAHHRDPFTDALGEKHVLQTLRHNPTLAAHFIDDEEFGKSINRLHYASADLPADRSSEAGARAWAAMSKQTSIACFADGRVLQAVMSLYARPPKPGVPRLAEPLQQEHLAAIESIEVAEEAKAKGNELFKAQNTCGALAFYQRALVILRMEESNDVQFIATLMSNMAMCFLKLNLFDRAKCAATQGMKGAAGDASYDQSKLYFRRAKACEGLEEFDNAVDDIKKAKKEVERNSKDQAEIARLTKEQQRLQRMFEEKDKALLRKSKNTFFHPPVPASSEIGQEAVREYDDANKWTNGVTLPPRFDEHGNAVEARSFNGANAEENRDT